MNFKDIQGAIKHLLKTCSCSHCKEKYKLENIHIIATTQQEGLFEIHCKKCDHSTLVNVLWTPGPERTHGSISQNDILDTKNFLNNFDGNFKKIFNKLK